MMPIKGSKKKCCKSKIDTEDIGNTSSQQTGCYLSAKQHF